MGIPEPSYVREGKDLGLNTTSDIRVLPSGVTQCDGVGPSGLDDVVVVRVLGYINDVTWDDESRHHGVNGFLVLTTTRHGVGGPGRNVKVGMRTLTRRCFSVIRTSVWGVSVSVLTRDDNDPRISTTWSVGPLTRCRHGVVRIPE